MRTRDLFLIASRNLIRQRRRYALVAAAVAFGFALITVISGAAYGALDAVKAKAARYFSGHVTVSGIPPRGYPRLSDPEAVAAAVLEAKLPIRTIARRSSYYQGDAALFFGGETVRQRKLIGVDFDAEGREFSGFRYVAGGWEAMLDDPRGILISEAAAKLLGCRLSDDLTLFLKTDTGQYNTAVLVVSGIFSETSLFGYAAYIRSDTLNALAGRPLGAATDLALYAESGADLDALAERVRLRLEKSFPTLPRFDSREERAAFIAKGIGAESLSVMSLDAQLSQITQLLDALLYLSYFVLAFFVCIVMVGVLNTYRVIVHERTREIGAMRALGMKRSSVAARFLSEAALRASAASVVGLAVGAAAARGLALIDLSGIPAAGLVTERGRLRFGLNGAAAALNLAAMALAAVAAALGPSRKAAAIPPAAAMRKAA